MTRMCPSCEIRIEGEHDQCPLCRNELTGAKGPRVYPSVAALKAQSFVYKLQIFIFLTLMLAALAAEFLLDIRLNIHYSFVVCVWVIGGEIWLFRLLRRHSNPSKLISICGFYLALLVLLTFIILGDILNIYFLWILPGIAIAAELLHFAFMLTDRTNNALIYLLGCSVLCIAMGIVFMVVTRTKHILWVICLFIGVVALIGAVIFKGRSVTSEMKKRFSI